MAKKVNTQFALILGCCVVGLVVGGYALRRILIKQHPEQFKAAARQAEKEGRLSDAIDDWKKALQIAPRDTESLTGFGITLHRYGLTQDPELLREQVEVKEWNSAIEVNPDYLPAVEELCNYWEDKLYNDRLSQQALTEGAKWSKEALRLAPDSPDAPQWQGVSDYITLASWVAGLETDQAKVDAAEKDGQALMLKHPDLPRLAFMLTYMDIHRAQLLIDKSVGGAQSDDVNKMLKQAADQMAAGIKGAPSDPLMHYYGSIAYTVMGTLNRFSPAESQLDSSLAAQSRKKAMALVQPTDPNYTTIYIECASSAKDPQEKKESLTTLMRTLGSDPQTVMAATELLTSYPDLREGAIASLKSAYDQESKSNTMSLRRFQISQSMVKLQLAELADAEQSLADAARGGAATQPSYTAAQRDELKKDISDRLAQMAASAAGYNGALEVVRSQAEFSMIEKDFVGTIQLLTRAMATNNDTHNDWRLNWVLANAFMQANEREQAVDYCQNAIDFSPAPGFLPARILLVELLSGTGSDQARRRISQQLEFLQKIAPHDPDVIRLTLAQAATGAVVDKDALYKQLPEDTVGHLYDKAKIALMVMKQKEEAARLLKLAMNIDKGDVETVALLVQVDDSIGGRQTEELAAVDGALELHPGNPTLMLLQKQLENESPAEIKKFQDKLAADEPSFQKYMRAGVDALLSGDNLKAEQNLKEAEKIKPDDKDVVEKLYLVYLNLKEWDKSDPYLKKLAAMNADQAHGQLYEFQRARAKNDPKLQLTLAQGLVASYPEFALSYFCLAQAYQANGQYTEAIANYDTAMQKKGVEKEGAQWLVAEIHCYYEMNKPEAAKLAIDEGIRRYPDDPEFTREQISYEVNYGDAQAAATQLEDWLKTHPDDPAAYVDLAKARMHEAYHSISNGDLDAAKTSATAAVDVLKTAMGKFPDDERVYENLSQIVQFGGDLAGAEKVLTQFAARPNWQNKAQPQSLLGELYATEGQYPKAEAAYAKALTLADDQEKDLIRYHYAEVLMSEKKFDQALAVVTVPGNNNPHMIRERLRVMYESGKFDEAENDIKKLLAQPEVPDKAALQSGWAQLELARGNRDAAMEHVNLALADDSKYGSALVLRARLRMGQTPPDLDGAMSDLEASRLAMPSDVETLELMSNVYLARNRIPDAVRVLQVALRTAPADLSIRLQLASILTHSQPPQLAQAMDILQEGRGQPGGNKNPELYNTIAQVFVEKGDMQSAVKTVIDGLGMIPNDGTLLHSYLQLMLAAQQYQTVIDTAGKLIDGQPTISWAWEFRGMAKAQLKDKDMTGAMADLSKAMQLCDAQHDISGSINIIGGVADLIGVQQAIDMTRQHAEADPGNEAWQVTLISLCHKAGQDKEAIPLVDKYVAKIDKLPQREQILRLQLAGLIYADAQPQPASEKAYAAYKRLLVLSPDDVEALNNFACLCADGFVPPKADEGLTAVKHAIDVMANRGVSDPLVEESYGWLMIQNGQTTEGMDIIHKALGRKVFPEGYYHLAMGYMKLNRLDEAQQQISQALDEITRETQANRPVAVGLKGKVENLSNKVLDALRVRTTGSVP